MTRAAPVTPSARTSPEVEAERLHAEIAKLRRINAALVDRVERSTDMHGGAFSLFETAIALEAMVRDRTGALEDAMAQLATANAELADAHSVADAARMRLRDAIESINEGFALFDAQDRLVLWNEAYLGFWPKLADYMGGNPGRDLTFHQILRIVAEDQQPMGALVAPDRWVSDRLARHSVQQGGHVQALSDGRWIQINELRTSEGGIVGIYTDITEAKAEDARERARELGERNIALQAILDNLSEGVCMFDRDGRLTAWNGALQRLLGLPEHIGGALMTHGDLVHWCRDRVGMADGRALDWREGEETDKVRRLCAVGDRNFEIRSTAIARGGMVISFEDVTDRMKVQMSLQETADMLERRVAERTGELVEVNRRLEREIAERRAIEEQLLDAKTAAEKANLSKTSFIAAASHDLLQPLNAARLFTAALAERRLALPTRALVNQTSTALDSVEDLLEALLEISRLDAGAIQPEIGHFRIDYLLATLRTEFAPMAAAAGLDFSVSKAPFWVESDIRLLRRILQNFISNAIRYTRRGSVGVTCMEGADGALTISVTDTGPGIAADKQEQIFEEFRRLDTGNRVPGKGLGLAIVRRAGDMLKHRISLRSAPGQGACFAITVPRGEAKAADIAEAPLAARDKSMKGRTILVIDNEAPIQAGMQTLLGGWGCRVLTAEGGAAAQQIVAAEGIPDAIIADYHLEAGETGDGLIGALRDRIGRPVPAIIVSADRSDALKARLDALALPLLGKPVKPAQLRALLRTMLS